MRLHAQYEGLEKLYRRYREKGCDPWVSGKRFRRPGAGVNKEIAQFCRLNYGVTFPMFAKRPSWVRMQTRCIAPSPRRPETAALEFPQVLLDRAGQPVAVFESAVEPADSRVTSQIEKLIAAR